MTLLKSIIFYAVFIQAVILGLEVLSISPVFAQIPPSADASRLEGRDELRSSKPVSPSVAKSSDIDVFDVPPETTKIKLTLNEVNIDGRSEFRPEKFNVLYRHLLGTEITLDKVYVIAAQITDIYRQNGFLLSRAFVPQQEIINGSVKIEIVEGYIASVNIDHRVPALESHFNALKEEFLSNKPVSSNDIETFLLRLNDFPGVSAYGTLEPNNGDDDAAVDLSVIIQEKDASGFAQVDNYGSKFLGPYQINASYRDDFIPGQNTTISIAKALDGNELSFVSLRQEIPLTPKLGLKIQGAYTDANPGFTLEPLDVESNSKSLRIGLNYKHTRQLQENLTLSAAFQLRNASSDTLGFELSRDRTRSIELGANYNRYDQYSGLHSFDVNLVQGVRIFNGSDSGDLNLSRAQADPYFTLIKGAYDYQNFISPDWLLDAHFKAQISSSPLFSSQEFGVGGGNFGRAYDFSEITGDSGIAAGLKLSYRGLDTVNDIFVAPYAFIDGGRVSNRDSGGESSSAISAGAGFQLFYSQNIHFNAGLAFPLTRDISNPLNGNERSPRLRLGLAYDF